MDLESTAAFFRRLMTRRQAVAADDPADMGTAFGLEASLGPVSDYPPAGDPAAPAGADEAPMNWLARRLRAR